MSSCSSCTGIFGISSYILTENWTHFKKKTKSLKLQFSTTSLAFLPPLFKNLLVLFPFDGCRPMYGDPSLPAENRGGQVALDVALLWFEFSEWRQPCPGKNRAWKTILPIGWGWDVFLQGQIHTRCSGCSEFLQTFQVVFPISFTNKWSRTLIIISSRVIPSRIKNDEFDLLLCLHFPYIVMHWMTCVCNYTCWSLRKRNNKHSGYWMHVFCYYHQYLHSYHLFYAYTVSPG